LIRCGCLVIHGLLTEQENTNHQVENNNSFQHSKLPVKLKILDSLRREFT